MNKLKPGDTFVLLCFVLISTFGLALHKVQDPMPYAIATWAIVFGYLIHLLINYLND